MLRAMPPLRWRRAGVIGFARYCYYGAMRGAIVTACRYYGAAAFDGARLRYVAAIRGSVWRLPVTRHASAVVIIITPLLQNAALLLAKESYY